MHIVNLFKSSYWFTQPDIAFGAVKWLWVGVFLALLLAGLVFKILKQTQQWADFKEPFRRFGNLGIVTGFLGLLWMFLRQEYIPFFSRRFWLLVIFVVFIFWFYRIARYLMKRLPQIKAEKQMRTERDKYLPKKK